MTPGKERSARSRRAAKQSSISPADPCTIVIFGASGDLSRRKLVPALYGLAAQNCLARRFAIIGFARTPMTDEAFQNSAVDSVKKFADANTLREAECKEFADALAYVVGRVSSSGCIREIEEPSRGAGQGAQTERKPPLLSGHAAGRLSWNHRTTGQSGPGEESRTENPGRESSSKSRTAAIWLRRES